MYVVEDGDFKFSDDLAARFAKGELITFQDNNERLIKLASLRMRKETCKMYNLDVEGQGKNDHTYYASGILVTTFARDSGGNESYVLCSSPDVQITPQITTLVWCPSFALNLATDFSTEHG